MNTHCCHIMSAMSLIPQTRKQLLCATIAACFWEGKKSRLHAIQLKNAHTNKTKQKGGVGWGCKYLPVRSPEIVHPARSPGREKAGSWLAPRCWQVDKVETGRWGLYTCNCCWLCFPPMLGTLLGKPGSPLQWSGKKIKNQSYCLGETENAI